MRPILKVRWTFTNQSFADDLSGIRGEVVPCSSVGRGQVARLIGRAGRATRAEERGTVVVSVATEPFNSVARLNGIIGLLGAKLVWGREFHWLNFLPCNGSADRLQGSSQTAGKALIDSVSPDSVPPCRAIKPC